MKRIIIITFLTIISLGAKSQFSVNYSAGYASYKMNDMKELMTFSLQMGISSGNLPPNAKLVDIFPAYVMHTVDVGYQSGNKVGGLKLSYMTTGSKIAVADYSGSYEEKLITNGYRMGVFYRHHFCNMTIKQHSLSFFAELSPALTIATMKTKSKLEINKSDNTTLTEKAEEINQKKTGYSIQPLAGARFKLYNHLLLTASAGYDFEFGASLGSGYRMDFSGFRINAGVGYMF
ncbi:MAG: hypothetical protein PHO36_10990 [Parabacteroides sp.]|nr:hypothetical protein [Parabacteroides sp.]